MSKLSQNQRAPLGRMSVHRFLSEYWQKKPLVIRQALRDLTGLVEADRLFELAARDDVESRLVTSFGGKWQLRHGPIAARPRRNRDWTILVQGVNQYEPAIDRLMRRFDFVPNSRLDDIMISYAADGGGVGPHFDSYDVFLLQVQGQRHWRVSTQRDLTLRTDVPLKILADFQAQHDWILDPGDMLYLPPQCAHDGVAIGPCMTYSIGFRAPAHTELAREFLYDLADQVQLPGRFSDAGRPPTRHPGRLDPLLVDASLEILARVSWTRRDIARFLGRYFTEPKANVVFDWPPKMSPHRFARDAVRYGLSVDAKSLMLYDQRSLFLNGELFDLDRRFVEFADRRTLPGERCADLMAEPSLAAMLLQWYNAGWITFGSRGEGDAYDKS